MSGHTNITTQPDATVTFPDTYRQEPSAPLQNNRQDFLKSPGNPKNSTILENNANLVAAQVENGKHTENDRFSDKLPDKYTRNIANPMISYKDGRKIAQAQVESGKYTENKWFSNMFPDVKDMSYIGKGPLIPDYHTYGEKDHEKYKQPIGLSDLTDDFFKETFSIDSSTFRHATESPFETMQLGRQQDKK